MTRISAVAVGALLLGACAAGMGAPRDLDMPTTAIHAHADATPADVAAAVRATRARAAFVAAAQDSAWFTALGTAADLHLSGPATTGNLRMAFLAPEPLGDTTHTLGYEGGSFTIQDALYEIREERYLDLIAFQIDDDTPVEAAVAALLAYVATDVDNVAAVVMAAAVPDTETGDRVARMLGPAYFDALRCDNAATAPAGPHIRLFYGPAARMYCEGARTESAAAGDLIHADLIMGRR